MKNLLIGFLAFVVVLGTSCKKSDEVANSKPATEVKKELSTKDLKPNVLGLYDNGGGSEIGGGGTYPHNTGGCTCGSYATCYPRTYWTFQDNADGSVKTIKHITAYGQTTFPVDAYFPGNAPN